MTKNFKRTIITVFTVLLLLTVFAGCDNNLPWNVGVWGTWDDGFSGEKTFTNTTFNFDGAPVGDGGWDYSGTVTKYVNGSFNIASENPDSGDYGYMVVEITEHDGDSTQIGDFTVIRWWDYETTDGTTTVVHSEGYPHFDSAAEAESEATADTNFIYYSSLTKVQ